MLNIKRAHSHIRTIYFLKNVLKKKPTLGKSTINLTKHKNKKVA